METINNTGTNGLRMIGTEQTAKLSMIGFASVPSYRCPVCKNESGGSAFDTCAITVTIEPHTGLYCLKCYSAWIAANVPKLEEI